MLCSKVLFIVGALLLHHVSAYSAKTGKCKFSDGECQKALYGTLIQENAETGFPDFGIPPFDPFEVKDMEISLLGLLLLKVQGYFKGFKTCHSNKFQTDPHKLINSIELICDLIIVDGRYEVNTTPTLDALIGGIKVHGKGTGTVKIEKLRLNIEVPFDIKKLDDGQLHAVLNADGVTFGFAVLEKSTFVLDNVYIGSQEISAVVTNVMNENWDFIIRTFGKNILDRAIKIYIENANKFFAGVPITDLVSDDLTSYISH